MNLFDKICQAHGLDSDADTLVVHPDQVLTHDGTATSVFLQLEAMDIARIKPFTVVYIDHNTLQVGYSNPDDHKYLKTMAAKQGAIYSRPGNGICHQVHLENFTKPGQILLGSDSHTSTAGGLACLGLGAGGLDVASVLAGEPYYLPRPRVTGVYLTGSLPPWTSGKDVILHLLGEISVKGGVGCILEYFGPGVGHLSVDDRATICNMGAETGATSSLFPSDERTLKFLKRFGREKDYSQWKSDNGDSYQKTIEIHLSELEPMVALPDSPDNVKPVSRVKGIPVQQICIGSCTNSSFKDLAVAARLLKNKAVHPDTVLVISPGSRRTLASIAESKDLQSLIKSGARILEPSCGPCNGIGQSPESNSNTLRSHNRNFRGRCGTIGARSYLSSVEVASVSALTGVITDPRDFGKPLVIKSPRIVADLPDLFLPPSDDPETITVVKGPNIKPIPVAKPPEDRFQAKVALKLGDDITTDDILPGGAKMLSLRSNVPASVPFIFNHIDTEFVHRIDQYGPAWLVVAGDNYGQGSAREHAVMVPMYAGLRLVIAKSFSRIYRQNLINFGVVPLIFQNTADYDLVGVEDELQIVHFSQQLYEGSVTVLNASEEYSFVGITQFNDRERSVMLKGGLLNTLREKYKKN